MEATKLLLDHGAFPNHLDFSEERFSPLDGALIGGHNEVAQLLIEHGGLSINRIQVRRRFLFGCQGRIKLTSPKIILNMCFYISFRIIK